MKNQTINLNFKEKIDYIRTKKIFFWGYGNTNCYEFYTKLIIWKAGFDITHLIDIRAKPRGWAGCYHKSWLKINIKKYGLKYIHIFELGNPYSYNLPIYESKYIQTKQFKFGIKNLFSILLQKETKNVLLFCAEKYYNQCHRKIIANFLQSDLFLLNIIHLSTKDKKKVIYSISI